ncbi:MAG: acyltransferase family protein [Mycobacteriales bacterium]
MKGFRPDVEGLRGVAVLLVVAGHLTGWPRGGFLGVDVFFVLSGFLITGLLADEGERTGRISLRRFYARRARRLLPVAVLVLIATDLAAGLLLLPARAHATVVDSLWSLASLANVHFARLGTDYFSLTRPPSAVQHYWSLSVEEQFYFVWPTLALAALALARHRGWPARRLLVVLALLVVAGSFTWSVVSGGASYFSSPARAWELGVGALLALAGLQVQSRPGFAVLGGVGLLASVLVIGPTTAVPGYAAALPALATVTLLHGAPPVLGWRPLRYVGRISYSLYLWHWPVVVLAADVPGGTSTAGKVLCALLVLALSVGSYHVVEAPVRASSWLSPKPRGRRRPSWAPAVGVGAVAAFVGAYVLTVPAEQPRAVPAPVPVAVDKGEVPADLTPQIRAGLALRDWPAGLDDVASLVVPEWGDDKCLDVGPRNADRCTYGPAEATKDAALLGDSVAISWMPALRKAADDGGFRLHVLTRRQCPNARIPGGTAKAVSASCAEHQQWAAEQVLRMKPDLVVLSNRYGDATAAQWADGTAAAFARLAPAGSPTVVLAPPPETGNLQKCYTRLSRPQQCTASISTEYDAFLRVERAAAVQAGARFVDTRSWSCLDGRCPAIVAGLPVHFDGRHLSEPYARLLGPYVSQAVRIS